MHFDFDKLFSFAIFIASASYGISFTSAVRNISPNGCINGSPGQGTFTEPERKRKLGHLL